MSAWYNYIILATFKGLKQPQGLKQPLLVSGAAPVQCFINCFICFKQFQIVSSCSNCFKLFKLFQVVQIVSSCSNCFKLFKLFKVVQIVITSVQQPACHPMIVISLINKVGDQFNN